MGKKTKKKHYVESADIEQTWAHWLDHEDEPSWHKLSSQIYLICQGVARKYNPRDEEEHCDLTHETFALTMEKVKSRKLVFEAGRAPVFNLLTTTIHRHLLSLMNKRNRQKRLLMTKYAPKSGLTRAASIDGSLIQHPDSNRMLSNLMAQLHEAHPPTLNHKKKTASSARTKAS